MWPTYPLSSCTRETYFHDPGVVGKGRDPQALHYDVRQVVRIQHEMLTTVLQQLLIVFPLILLDVFNYRKAGHLQCFQVSYSYIN